MRNQLEALIVGASAHNLWGLPFLLSRAGFAVDAVATVRVVRFSKFVRSAHVAESREEMMRLVQEIVCNRPRPYDWIIPAEDETLEALSRLEWPAEMRPAFLPDASAGRASHFFSKIGLSSALDKAGIQTPPFRVVSSCEQALVAAREIGYPVMLKVDASFGGNGVRNCVNEDDIIRHAALFEQSPLLMQRVIKGREIAIDAVYIRHQLAHFSYSHPLRYTQTFGPAILRRHFPLPLVDEKVFGEVAMLGRALGADGFLNIACIDAEDGSGRYYFEADMRPNVWVDSSRYFGEDAAERICKGFSSNACLTKASLRAPAKCVPVEIPYFLRLQCWELVRNRHRVWKFIPLADTGMVVRLLAGKFFWCMYCHVCFFLPRGLKTAIRRALRAVRSRPAPNLPTAADAK